MKSTIKNSDEYVALSDKWRDELMVLYDLLKSTELYEKIKWGIPVFCYKNKNVVGVSRFKDYVGMWFFQGVFLKDDHKLLINAQEGVTKGLRQIHFKSMSDINPEIIKEYVLEAIENQKMGKEIEKVKAKELELPQLLEGELKSKNIMHLFEQFTLYKRNEFIEYIASAKREQTKLSRLEKIIPMIEKGIGLNDKYKKQ